VGYEELSEQQEEDEQSRQHGKPYKPRALLASYHRDQTDNDEEIIILAEEESADLVVMGSRGLGA
jgi:nucleotide-binding universal stress UspA family protein